MASTATRIGGPDTIRLFERAEALGLPVRWTPNTPTDAGPIRGQTSCPADSLCVPTFHHSQTDAGNRNQAARLRIRVHIPS